ncbi:class I SAM-dependent methyltransferase [Sinorhizobium terangae]|uniref:Methyltransferase domain-containing protein n=1 Tax=Sinorhizobium terangae TaxID=110322 RepID=A0A6N7LT68_SINTE|nr:methyltransferase domain-containing protein [Sinorhizobium terangae]MBB4185790.1 protein-L-isoaspartate O-methyltransferase [Sinorhizobium terangae]MQX19415.1 methyltransferase domain-containing protein [Sinorhizobium terangae]WFU46849.1 methyltransferase domain-containing protein [Sinorhizobium terangae]
MPNDRIGWAVDVLAPRASERILEIGCGHGVAVTMVCDRLTDGHIVAVDRSATMIAAAKRRNAVHLAAGRVQFHAAELASADFGEARFDKAFALRVGVFARNGPVRELEVLARHLSPAGRLFLFHDEPSRSAADVARRLEAGIRRNAWTVAAVLTRRFDGCDVACVIAVPPKRVAVADEPKR